MLWLIVRESKVVKLNINVDPNVAFTPHCALNCWPFDLTRLKIVRLGAKSIPGDWDSALLNALIGRIHPPITIELLGRKLTMIIDGHGDVVERVVHGGRVDLPRCNPDGSVEYGDGFTKIKIVLLFRNSELPQAQSLRNVDAKQHDKACSDSNIDHRHFRPSILRALGVSKAS